jgi:hypothetical protein
MCKRGVIHWGCGHITYENWEICHLMASSSQGNSRRIVPESCYEFKQESPTQMSDNCKKCNNVVPEAVKLLGSEVPDPRTPNLAKQYQKTSTRKGKHAVLESHLKKAGVI